MKTTKFIFMLLLVMIGSLPALFGQCPCAATDYASINVAGWTVGQTGTITTCQFGGERSTINNTVAGGVYLISSCGAGYDTQLSIYTTACVYVAYNDDNGPACAGTAASVQFTSPGGNLYSVLSLYYCSTLSACMTVTIQLISLPGSPANDLVCNATAIGCGSTLAGTTINATNAGTGENGTCGVAQTQPGVWYVIAGNGQVMTAALCGTAAWDSKISVFSGPNCAALTCVGGNDDNGPACAGLPASYSWTSVVGTNYYILVHGYGSNSAFNIAISCVALCAGLPNAGTASISVATGCTGINFTLSSAGLSAGTGITYQWQSSPTGLAPWTNIVGATGTTYVTSTASTLYYRLVTTCSNSGLSNNTNVVSYTVVQCYIAPTAGIAGTYVGACMVNTCSGNFYDDGGPAGNYSNSINNTYRTFCPGTAGNCLQATVNYITMENGWDYIKIQNGPTQNSPVLASVSNAAAGTTYISTDPSGCLTFRIVTDGSVVQAGFDIALSCVACAGGPTGLTNADCSNATQICSNANIVGASIGPGLVSESCLGCTAGGENYSNFYVMQVATSGVLALTINPTVNTDDYDFALYGPNVTCGTLGAPIRCSYAATPPPGNTGMGNGAIDVSEDVLGDSWLAPLNVVVGEIYYLMINKWDPTPGSGFMLQWTGGPGGNSTASLNCAVLPISLVSFTGDCDNGEIHLYWTTSSETNNNYFTIERSKDGVIWIPIKTIAGAGNSNQTLQYSTTDETNDRLMYYRLIQTDYDGKQETFPPISVSCGSSTIPISIHPNPTSNVLFIETGGREADYQLFNGEGQNVLSGKSDVVDMTRFSTGLYFIKIMTTDGEFFSSKVVKQGHL